MDNTVPELVGRAVRFGGMPTVSLRTSLATLRREYGRPAPPVSSDPFELIVWEQVAYLVPDSQRRMVYETWRAGVGLNPAAIMRASAATLTRIARLGGAIAAPLRAQRLRQSAEHVLQRWGGRLADALDLPFPMARRALTAFAMIGEPSADRILLFTRTARVLALDSNALRVLSRLGLITTARSYRTTYRDAQARLATALPKPHDALIAASQLLRLHGQRLCKAGAPRCARCPLRRTCPTAGAAVSG